MYPEEVRIWVWASYCILVFCGLATVWFWPDITELGQYDTSPGKTSSPMPTVKA